MQVTISGKNIELVTIGHSNKLMCPQSSTKKGSVGQMIQDKLGKFPRVGDKIFQLFHGQIHEGCVGGSKNGPWTSQEKIVK